MTFIAPRFYAVILAGGSGTRLWPLSRRSLPKQLLAVAGEESLLQETARRLLPVTEAADIFTVAHALHEAEVAAQLGRVDPRLSSRILAEPLSRNTLPAIAWAVAVISRSDPRAVIGVFPSDHAIGDIPAFHGALKAAVKIAGTGVLCLFGIPPALPSTAYGYIETAGNAGEVRDVLSFKEKPELATAEAYVRSGRHFWNGGIFVFRAVDFRTHLERLEPRIAAAVEEFAGKGQRADEAIYRGLPELSMDYGLIEKLDGLKMVSADFGWSDLGGWGAVYSAAPKDSRGNAVRGKVFAHNARGNLLWNEDGRALAVYGASKLAVIQARDATLVCPLADSDGLKTLVAEIETARPELVASPAEETRPWGRFTVLDEGPGFKVKKITVGPGQCLSLQMHKRRAEHWVVVAGEADVEIDGVIKRVVINESVHIPRGGRHRLSNRGSDMLVVIETQTGDYLGEDDIVRFEDSYGRAG